MEAFLRSRPINGNPEMAALHAELRSLLDEPDEPEYVRRMHLRSVKLVYPHVPVSPHIIEVSREEEAQAYLTALRGEHSTMRSFIQEFLERQNAAIAKLSDPRTNQDAQHAIRADLVTVNNVLREMLDEDE